MLKQIKRHYRKYKATKELKKINNNKNLEPYEKILEFFHNQKTPKTYLEIGVNDGRSIMLAHKKTKTIGVDPTDSLTYLLNKNTKMFFMTSDDFFKKYDVIKLFNGEKIDLSFIDGMHLFEYALRDFINIEKHCHKNSTIVMIFHG